LQDPFEKYEKEHGKVLSEQQEEECRAESIQICFVKDIADLKESADEWFNGDIMFGYDYQEIVIE